MRNYQEEPVTIVEVDAALARAIESTQWATQKDDEVALRYLHSFLKSTNIKSHLYIHLIAQHPAKSKTYEDPEIKQLDLAVIAPLYASALRAEKITIVSSVYAGVTHGGSFEYLLNLGTYRPIHLYVRRCRGELRGEVNEDNFSIIRAVTPPPPEPKGFISFIKKIWNSQ